MDFVVKETGARNVAHAHYRGYRIEVISEMVSRRKEDGFTLHAFVQRVSESGERVGGLERVDCPLKAPSVELAFVEGFRSAGINIDLRPPVRA